MDGSVATGAKHGEVFWLGLADAAGQGDAVVGLDQVEPCVFLLGHRAASLADDVPSLGLLAGQLLGQLGGLGISLGAKVSLQDLAAFSVLKVLRSVFAALAAARVHESFRQAYKRLHQLRFVGDLAEDQIIEAADGFEGVMAVAHLMPFDAYRVKSALCELLCPENLCRPVFVSTCDDTPCVDVTVKGL